jgi:DNA-binding response OmpR family regulator
MAGRRLVVNDEPNTGRALQAALASEGFDVILATDDGEVLEVVRAAVAELIKLDSGVTLNANVFKAAG